MPQVLGVVCVWHAAYMGMMVVLRNVHCNFEKLMSLLQVVVTAICPVLPPATAILQTF